jgi:hypothetical protein
MSQSDQQGRGAAPVTPKGHRQWEMFWRIIAGLMLLTIAWVAWVLYQISPRSVVTPLAYESPVKPAAPEPIPAGTAAQTATAAPATAQAAAVPPQARPEVEAAALLMDQTQAALRAGAHQPSADVQAAAAAGTDASAREGGLRLATEIHHMPLDEKQEKAKTQEGAAPLPAAAGAAGKARP